MNIQIMVGDCLERLKEIADGSIHCCVTSPPYWGLRDYGMNEQIGLEETPQAYVEKMVLVFREIWRVLRDDGNLWLNIGDSYANNASTSNIPRSEQGNGTGSFAMYSERQHLERRAKPNRLTTMKHNGLKHKDLVGIPWRLAFALQADGWYLRSDIIWAKPNPMPESVTDRPTKGHEYVFLLTKNERYFYDADALRESHSSIDADGNHKWTGKPVTEMRDAPHKEAGRRYSESDVDPIKGEPGLRSLGYHPLGRNARTVWSIASQPFSGAHFATMPPALVERCIKAGCPEGGVVIDPFGGAGTTALVAARLQRDSILIELNPKYAEIARERIASEQPLFSIVSVK